MKGASASSLRSASLVVEGELGALVEAAPAAGGCLAGSAVEGRHAWSGGRGIRGHCPVRWYGGGVKKR
nr:hypothetical protein [Candidatus Sigynarchaeum springense]